SVVFSGVTEFEYIRRSLMYPGFIVMACFVFSILLYKVDGKSIGSLIRLLILSCVSAAFLEAFARFLFPTLDLRNDVEDYVLFVSVMNPSWIDFLTNQYFYAYKFSSIM